MASGNVKKGDEVEVLSGKDRGRRAKVLRVMPNIDAVILEGLNIAKRHTKANKSNPQGGVIDKSLPLKRSKVMVVCPGCNKPTRVRREKASDDNKVRVCIKCNQKLD